jgi:hypothetical protein
MSTMTESCKPQAMDVLALRDAFHRANMIVSQRARWCADDPGADPKLCRYCGRHRQTYPGSKLDGHAACIVTDDFKHQLSELLRTTPTVTYEALAAAIGVSSSVVRSWTYPIKGIRRR